MKDMLTIGQLARLTGTTPKTVRYYEEAGVLPAPRRNTSRYRVYSEVDVRRLQVVRRARLLDLSLSEIQEMVQWAGSSGCDDFRDRFLHVVRRKLEAVDKRMADLGDLRADLESLEAHLGAAGGEQAAGHAMLECRPETCACLETVSAR